MLPEAGEFWITRLLLQRAMAATYLVAFSVAVNQFIPLCGERGLVPVSSYLHGRSFWDVPGLFFFFHSDRFIHGAAWTGVALSVLALSGLSERGGLALSICIWASLWTLYLSFVNTGQTFYSFGWETLLLEAGFLTIFLGPSNLPPPVLIIWLFRWLLFRLMLGAGLIKIRGDPCWRDFTCMLYHYETQPMPNPLSWYFHRMPIVLHKGSVLFNHFVELVVPWAYFIPGRIAWVAGGFTILFHLLLILSGNFSWLNWLSLALAIPCFDDHFWGFLPLSVPIALDTSALHKLLVAILTVVVAVLSLRPIQNMLSSLQVMNTSFDSFHLVNTYGAFGSITRVRREIVIEGTNNAAPDEHAEWREYEFKGKPGDAFKRPRQFAPYHLRLDWLMWFAAMGPPYYSPWFSTLLQRILAGQSDVLALFEKNPFPEGAPRYVRARLYRYWYTSREEHARTGAWWNREDLGLYYPAIGAVMKKK